MHVVANSSLSTALRLLVMRERDEFMSVDQLESMGKKMRGEEGAVPGVGHFQLESPSYSKLVAWMVLNWLDKIPA